MVEVCFTSIYDMVEKYWNTSEVDFRLIGYSHIWAIFIYGAAMVLIEKLYMELKDKLHLIIRLFIYVVTVYLVEYTCGTFLSLFQSCPWDYRYVGLQVYYRYLSNYFSHLPYNVNGIITFAYAPFWFLAVAVFELILIQNVMLLRTHKEKIN